MFGTREPGKVPPGEREIYEAYHAHTMLALYLNTDISYEADKLVRGQPFPSPRIPGSGTAQGGA